MIKASLFINEHTYPRCNHRPRIDVSVLTIKVTWTREERFLRSAILKLERHENHQEGLLNHGSILRGSATVVLRWTPDMCISNKFLLVQKPQLESCHLR